MTWIRRLELRNFGPFRGEHAVDLEPIVYGVRATVDGAPDRSNWAGKSTLVDEAVRFALYGYHRHRTEDEFISTGEDEGEVRLTLSTGAVVQRGRVRGKSTRLTVSDYEDGRTGAEAQARVEAIVGLSHRDFVATCAFEQKRMARMLVAEPSERMRIVAGWLRLEPLQACGRRVLADAASLADVAAAYRERAKALRQRAADMLAPYSLADADPRTIDEALTRAADEANARVEQHTALAAQLEAERDAGRAAWDDANNAVRYAEILEQGRAAVLELAEAQRRLVEFKSPTCEGTYTTYARVPPAAVPARLAATFTIEELEAALEVAQGDHRVALETKQRRTAALRGFDGHCPVMDKACPAARDVDAYVKSRHDLAQEAARDADITAAQVERVRGALARARELQQNVVDLERRITDLRKRAVELKPAATRAAKRGPPPDDNELRERVAAAHGEASRAEVAAGQILGLKQQVAELRRDAAASDRHATETQAKLDLQREASAVFGRAQRRVAEAALERIEEQANALLSSCGIDLRVSVRWSREGEGLADACDGCGAPYPASRKVKACARCGAVRGPKLVNKLELAPSSSSGAAEDLAGIAFQLAAAAWLRAERGAAWGTAVVDEPFGALDARHRRGLGAHLATMLSGGFGFEQGFVVAHHQDAIDALPGRILVVREDGWSRVEVEG